MNEKLNYFLKRRYSKTLDFLKQAAAPPQNILDLGTPNRFTEIMKENGYLVENSSGEDLDNNYQIVANDKFDIITAFEIFEHLVAPYNLLKEAKAKKLIASVPLKQFFANAYWNDNDPWDQHFHEFEPRQFDMLLNKSGWKIIKSEKWTAPVRNIGIRPILRLFVKRYYIVYCERI
jgi:hypothetical protein